MRTGRSDILSMLTSVAFVILFHCPPLHADTLHEAVSRGDLGMVKMLGGFGTNIDELDHHGTPPLFYAIATANNSAFDYLIEQGADPNLRANHENLRNITALDLALRYKRTEMIAELIALKGHFTCTRVTPLYEEWDPSSLRGEIKPGGKMRVLSYEPEHRKYRVTYYTKEGFGTIGHCEPTSIGLPQPASVEPGKQKKFTVPGAKGISYTACLPSSYSSVKPPPILYLFAANGRGDEMIDIFKIPAEKMGWIVIGCNGFKGKRSDKDVYLADLLFRDVRKNIPHDTSRATIAGMGKSAPRSYRFVRRFWNEFSGIITLGGHMDSYDRRYVFPEQTSFVVLNSKADRHANIWQDKDLMILRASGSARKYITYDSRNKRPPQKNLMDAMNWLSSRWQEQRTDDSQETQTRRGQRILAEAEKSLKAQNYSHTLQHVLEIAIHAPLSAAAERANELIAEITLNPAYMRRATLTPIADPDKNLSEILLYRARDREGFPCEDRLSRYELALAVGGKKAELAAETAYVLASCAEGNAQALNRAESLASYATDVDSGGWYGWHVRALLASIRGYAPRAVEYEKRAADLAPNDMKRICLKALGEYQRN